MSTPTYRKKYECPFCGCVAYKFDESKVSYANPRSPNLDHCECIECLRIFTIYAKTGIVLKSDDCVMDIYDVICGWDR